MKILVTGASGFLGSHIVGKLLEDGHKLRSLVRRDSDLSFLPLEKVEIIQGDLIEPGNLNEAIKGCDLVVHSAARVSDWGDYQSFYSANVIGTRNLLNVAKRSGIKRVILISSNAVLGEENCTRSKKESDPYNPTMPYLSRFFKCPMNFYRETKAQQEKESITFCEENNIYLTVLRPVWVYGEREFHSGPYEFCRTVLSGMPVLPMGNGNRLHCVNVKDVARAVSLAIEKELDGVRIYNIGNEEAAKTRDYFNLFCRSLGVKPPLYLPFWCFYPLGFLLEVLARLFNSSKPFLLTRARVNFFYCNNIYDIGRAREELDFTAQISLEEGIEEAVAWWRDNGFFDRKRKQKNIKGISRIILDARIATAVLTHYLKQVFKREVTLGQYLQFIKRLLVFSRFLKNYKAVKINGGYKLHLYLPAFGTKAFYTALDKFVSGKTVPSHVVYSITKVCPCHCEHCYQKLDVNKSMPKELMLETAKKIQDAGVSLFDIEGGEPFARYERLLAVVEALDERSEIWINATGHLASFEQLVELKQAGLYGLMVSIHHPEAEKHDTFLGRKGSFPTAIKLIRMCRRIGLSTVINCCPSKEMIEDGGLQSIMEIADGLGCSYVQFIHEKPSGNWAHRGSSMMEPEFLENQIKQHIRYNKAARYPPVLFQIFEASSLGCTAGGVERFYVNADGEVQPCEFLNISFGNVRDENFEVIYERMRKFFPAATQDWLCNTENSLIQEFIKERGITRFPIERDLTIELVKKFQSKKDVPFFKDLELEP